MADRPKGSDWTWPLGALAPGAWPMAAVAAASEAAFEFAEAWTHALAGAEAGAPSSEPVWTTPNRVALDLPTMRLRDFSPPGASGRATLIDAPFAIHTAAIADIAPGHSLVERLLAEGLGRLFLTEWKSATPSMRDFAIDTYLAELNVAIDDIGAPVDLVGLCQGGWLALAYAARFPDKVRALVLAGAPIDTARGTSALVEMTAATPLAVYGEAIRFGGGRMPGRMLAQRWPGTAPDEARARDSLGLAEDDDGEATRAALARFADWDAVAVDLPGPYYMQTVQWLYKENRLAAGHFEALGRTVRVEAIRQPLFLIAGARDEIVPAEQLLAIAGRVGTAPAHVETRLAPCGHLGLFMGAPVLATVWAETARWLKALDARPVRQLAGRTRARRSEADPAA